jgi:endonuclease/exonuclease/phosphatase family metal-dependent hydrolase
MGAARKKSWTRSLRRAAPRVLGVAMALDLLVAPATAAVLRVDGTEELPSVRWLRPDGPQRSELDRWRAAVGPVQLWSPPPSAPTGGAEIDAFHVVVWNTHVGAGSIERLVEDLRRGALTGGVPVEHFALLLQEVYRGGETVPAMPPGSRAARGVRPGESRRGIVEVARRTALHAYYVPSMRNGRGAADPEDRGNAILATLPLAGFTAIELPLERERRVAISADVAGTTTAGTPWRILLVNLHLDPRSSWSRIHRSFGAGRAGQVDWLLEALRGDEDYAVLCGDFNSWVGGAKEPALRTLSERLFLPGTLFGQPIPTLPVLGLTLDHLLYRLPSGATAETRVLADTYGSDHRPLLGRLRLDAD